MAEKGRCATTELRGGTSRQQDCSLLSTQRSPGREICREDGGTKAREVSNGWLDNLKNGVTEIRHGTDD